MGSKNPIADLQAEIDAEEAAGVTDEEVVEEAVEEKIEAAKEPAAKVEAAKVETPAEPATKARMVPIGRVNEETAKRRQAERDLAAANARIAVLDKAAKDGKPAAAVSDEDRQTLQATERARARLEVTVENFVSAGHEEFGKAEFDEISQQLVDLGAPDNLVLAAIEATGSAAAAARVIHALGQLDAAAIEELFEATKNSPIRLGARLAALLPAKAAKAAPADPPVKINGKTPQVSRAPAPIMPVGSARNNNDADISDDDSEEAFTEKFYKMMDKRSVARH